MKRRQIRWTCLLAAGALGASLLLAGCGASSGGNEAAQGAGQKAQDQADQAVEAAEEAVEEAAEETAAAAASAAEEAAAAPAAEEAAAGEATLTLFAAKSLNTVMEDVIAAYEAAHPGVKIVGNYDSSGTLMAQIEEGAACDIFFSAAQKQMNQLEEEGYIVDGSRHNVVNNQVVVVTFPDSGTQVTGLTDLSKAANMALADGSVPVGRYTRQALVNAGILTAPAEGDASQITTQEVSEALGGLEINECANVGAVAAAVSEGSNEVGTVYRSDTYGLEDRLVILETIPYDLTGDVIYPVAQVVNPEADDAQAAAALEFVNYIASEEAKEAFQAYYFDTDVTD